MCRIFFLGFIICVFLYVQRIETYNNSIFHSSQNDYIETSHVSPKQLQGTYSGFIDTFGSYMDIPPVNHHESPKQIHRDTDELKDTENLWDFENPIIKNEDNQSELLKIEYVRDKQLPIDPHNPFQSIQSFSDTILLSKGKTDKMVTSKEHRYFL